MRSITVGDQLKLHQLRDVIAVADLGSLRAAARHLNIAQSAITKSVHQLERELDVPLFERHKRGALLTPMGTLFVQRARAAVGELERAQEEISQHRGAGVGRVTVSLSIVPHMALLPSVIGAFNHRYPEVRLTVLESLGFHSVEAQMRAGGIDAYIGVAPETKISTEYQVESLFNNQRYVVGRSGNLHSGASSLHDLVDAHWIVSSTATANSSFAALFKQHQAKLPARITFAGSIHSQLIFLLNSDMLMVAPRQVLEFPPYVGRLVRIPIKEELDAPAMVMITRTALPLTPAAEHFCDLIRRAAVQQGGVESRATQAESKRRQPL